MGDYSTSAAAALAALNNSTDGGFVEEYRIGPEHVKRGKLVDQIKAAAMLEGLAARRSRGLHNVAKFTEARP
jgi:hypothetical protein